MTTRCEGGKIDSKGSYNSIMIFDITTKIEPLGQAASCSVFSLIVEAAFVSQRFISLDCDSLS